MDEPTVVTFLKSLFHLHNWRSDAMRAGTDDFRVYVGISRCSTCGKVRHG